jgi:hypothetical protein
MYANQKTRIVVFSVPNQFMGAFDLQASTATPYATEVTDVVMNSEDLQFARLSRRLDF